MPRINISFDDITYCVLVNMAKQAGELPGTYCRNVIKKTIPKFSETVLEQKFLQQNVFNSTKKKGKK
jgi:hypothetical protein